MIAIVGDARGIRSTGGRVVADEVPDAEVTAKVAASLVPLSSLLPLRLFGHHHRHCAVVVVVVALPWRAKTRLRVPDIVTEAFDVVIGTEAP